MTEPGPDLYAPPAPPKLGDPSTDPPMVVRVHPDDDPHSPGARRVIRSSALRLAPWVMVTGAGPGVAPFLMHDEVRTWPVQHPLVYGTAFRHAAAADARERGAVPEPAGDDLTGEDTRLFR